MAKLEFKKFDLLLKSARHQFLVKTKNGIYFITPQNYSSYNEKGFIAKHESSGKVEIMFFEDVVEIIIDSKKFMYN